MLTEILEKLSGLSEEAQQTVIQEAITATQDLCWVPNPGPQTEAFFCEADELFYGGSAGGGKSALAVGLAKTKHQRSLILRRINKDARKLAEAELIGKILGGDRDGWNGSDQIYRNRGQTIEFGGCEQEVDKQRYKGDPHDLIVFDEVTDFFESQYVFISIWNRSTDPSQRCRVVATGNPPTTADGLWVIERWAAWLDPNHPNPAKPGELRYYISDEEGQEREVDGRGPHKVGDREVHAKSRTFIPAQLSDNPELGEDYARVLDSLPKELRDAYRDGQFQSSLRDKPFQVIPTAWVKAAQERWKPDGFNGLAMTAMAFDPAGGGVDDAVLGIRYGGWYAPIETENGAQTADGSRMAAFVLSKRRDGCPVVVDMGGGYGGSVTLRMKDNGVVHTPFNGASESNAMALHTKLTFVNKRAEACWRFREALDPDQEGGSCIALPPDNELASDLCSLTWEMTPRGIKVVAKEVLRKTLGRSTGRGDVVIMALSEGNKAVARKISSMGRAPQVVMKKPRRK